MVHPLRVITEEPVQVVVGLPTSSTNNNNNSRRHSDEVTINNRPRQRRRSGQTARHSNCCECSRFAKCSDAPQSRCACRDAGRECIDCEPGEKCCNRRSESLLREQTGEDRADTSIPPVIPILTDPPAGTPPDFEQGGSPRVRQPPLSPPTERADENSTPPPDASDGEDADPPADTTEGEATAASDDDHDDATGGDDAIPDDSDGDEDVPDLVSRGERDDSDSDDDDDDDDEEGHSNPDLEYLRTKFDTRNTKNQKPKNTNKLP